jgi:DNA-binding IclR family transcriptional regulator
MTDTTVSPPAPADAAAVSSASDVKTIVKPVANAVAILKFLGAANAPATATQIARKLQINTSTCFNILRTLVGEGMVDFDSSGKTYRVGLGLVKFVRNVLSDNHHLTAVNYRLHELAETFRVTATLWRRVGVDRMVLVTAENSSADLGIHLRIGMRLPTLLGSTGRAVATRLGRSRDQLRTDFEKLRWVQPFTFDDYWADAVAAEGRGWAVDDGFFAAGVQTLSAPILDAAGALTAYSVTALTFRGHHDDRQVARMGEAVSRLARDLTGVLH